jgi:hypothetical protein
VVRLEDGRVVTGDQPPARLGPEPPWTPEGRLVSHRLLKLLAGLGCGRLPGGGGVTRLRQSCVPCEPGSWAWWSSAAGARVPAR